MTTITREHLEDEVLKSIQKKAESIMPKDAKVILFGSRARRDAKADSDWDILVLLNKDKIDEQDHDNYTYPLWELGWQINQMIHPIVYSMKDCSYVNILLKVRVNSLIYRKICYFALLNRCLI